MADLSSRVRTQLDAVIQAMKTSGTWDIERPLETAFTDMGAFGSRTMGFEQWLRWVFVPNVEGLLASGGPWPRSSSVAVFATREGYDNPVVAELVGPLSRFDALFNPPEPEAEPEPALGPAAEASHRSHLLLERGDPAGALLAIQEAIAHDPAFPNAHNFAGWTLLSQALPTAEPSLGENVRRAREAAVLHFQKALLAPAPVPEALSNLADTLVALGREDEAIATLERMGAEGPLAAPAHNWLAWYFMGKKELARAAKHGRAATRLAPDFGLAWGTLGVILELLGDEEEAYRAYFEGLAAAGMKNPGAARQRVQLLENALRARGKAPPELNPQGLAASRTKRANAVGRAILGEIMGMPEFANTGRVLTLGRAMPVQPGDVPTAWIGSMVSGRLIVHAVVSDLEVFCSVAVLTKTESKLVFRSIQVRGDLVSEATAAVAEWLRAGGDADSTSINPLDAAVMLSEILTSAVPARRGFYVGAVTNYYEPEQPAMASVFDESLGVLATARLEGGVRIELPADAGGARPVSIEVPTLARFLEVRSEIVEATLRAQAAR
jgi:uncharacterized protein YqcC (DUF446 family)